MATPTSRGLFLDIRHHGYGEAFARGFGSIDIHGESYRMSALRKLDALTLGQMLERCAQMEDWRECSWLFEALIAQTQDLERAFEITWGHVQSRPDWQLEILLAHLLRSIEDPQELLPAAQDDARCAFLLGSICRHESEAHDRTDRAWFTLYREAALAFLERARDLPAPDDGARRDYTAEVGPLLEAAMYLQFVQPRRTSSSYSSDSSLGGG